MSWPALIARARFGAFVPAFALAAALSVPAGAAGFTPGDLYLVTNSMDNGGVGIMHVAMPAGGAASVFYAFPGNNQMSSPAIYDLYRDLILFGQFGVSDLLAIDASAVVVPLQAGITVPMALASRGDGIVYLYYRFGNGTHALLYVDASNTIHDVLDQAGTAPFHFDGNPFLSEMIYDPFTNSLIGLHAPYSIFTSPCPNNSDVCVVKIPLTPNGQQVAGPLASTNFDVSPSGETVVGASHAWGAGILITVDTNSGAAEPRMTLLDPWTMTVSTFATNSSAATNAGAFSHVLGQAVVDNTFDDDLRAFSYGETSTGTPIATGTSGGLGSGEFARLVEIGSYGSVLDVAPRATRGGLALAVAPNPTFAAATLRYALARDERVSLTIRDVVGRTVRALVASESQPAGEREVRWDGRDDGGARVRPGVYTAVLRAGDTTGLRTIVVIR
jgi:hypothetical protein